MNLHKVFLLLLDGFTPGVFIVLDEFTQGVLVILDGFMSDVHVFLMDLHTSWIT